MDWGVKGLSDGSNLSRSFFGWASPTRWGSLGLAYGGYSLGNLYNEETLSLAYAHTLGDDFRWGTVLNHLQKSVGHDSQLTSGLAREAIGVYNRFILWSD